MTPRPVEKCSVLYEPGARRHALESDAKGPAVVYTATVVVHKYLRGCSEWREAVLIAHSPGPGIGYLAVRVPIGQVQRLLPEGRSYPCLRGAFDVEGRGQVLCTRQDRWNVKTAS